MRLLLLLLKSLDRARLAAWVGGVGPWLCCSASSGPGVLGGGVVGVLVLVLIWISAGRRVAVAAVVAIHQGVGVVAGPEAAARGIAVGVTLEGHRRLAAIAEVVSDVAFGPTRGHAIAVAGLAKAVGHS